MVFDFQKNYRTYFKIGTEYGLSKSQVMKAIDLVEDILIKHDLFRLLGKKTLFKNEIKEVIIDTKETSIEKPKKSKKNIILEKKDTFHKDSAYN